MSALFIQPTPEEKRVLAQFARDPSFRELVDKVLLPQRAKYQNELSSISLGQMLPDAARLQGAILFIDALRDAVERADKSQIPPNLGRSG